MTGREEELAEVARWAEAVSYSPFVQQEKGVFSCKVNERTALDGKGLSSYSRKRGSRQAQDSG